MKYSEAIRYVLNLKNSKEILSNKIILKSLLLDLVKDDFKSIKYVNILCNLTGDISILKLTKKREKSALKKAISYLKNDYTNEEIYEALWPFYGNNPSEYMAKKFKLNHDKINLKIDKKPLNFRETEKCFYYVYYDYVYDVKEMYYGDKFDDILDYKPLECYEEETIDDEIEQESLEQIEEEPINRVAYTIDEFNELASSSYEALNLNIDISNCNLALTSGSIDAIKIRSLSGISIYDLVINYENDEYVLRLNSENNSVMSNVNLMVNNEVLNLLTISNCDDLTIKGNFSHLVIQNSYSVSFRGNFNRMEVNYFNALAIKGNGNQLCLNSGYNVSLIGNIGSVRTNEINGAISTLGNINMR